MIKDHDLILTAGLVAGESVIRDGDAPSPWATETRCTRVWFRNGTVNDGPIRPGVSIIVTRERVYIFKNEKVGLDLSRDSKRKRGVRRDGDRVVIAAGSGQSRVSWAFRLPDDPEGWAKDIRGVLGGGDD